MPDICCRLAYDPRRKFRVRNYDVDDNTEKNQSSLHEKAQLLHRQVAKAQIEKAKEQKSCSEHQEECQNQ